jgi:predicted nucleic acid-binding protein
MLFETVSVLRSYVARGLMSRASGRESLERLLVMPISFPAPAGLAEKTWEIAARFGRPTAYDSFYLALSEIADIPFWTADASLHRTVHRALPRVHLLEKYAG